MASGRICFADNCDSSETLNPATKFFHFPNPGKNNIVRCRLWAAFCKPNECWTDERSLNQLHTTHKHICQKHFKADDFQEINRERLNVWSVPSITLDESSTPNLIDTTSSSNLSTSSQYIPSLISPVHMLDHNYSLPFNTAESLVHHPNPHSPISPINAPASSDVSSPSAESPPMATTSLLIHHPNPHSPLSPINPPATSDVIGQLAESPPIATSSSLQIRHPNPHSPLSPINLPATSDVISLLDLNTPLGVTPTKNSSILNALNVTRIAHLTPREQILYKLHKKKQKEIARLKREYKKLAQRKKSAADVLELEVFSKLPPALKSIIASTLYCSSKKAQGRRWSTDDKIQALTLFKDSPRDYDFLRKLFILPNPRTLRSLLYRISKQESTHLI